MNFKEGSDNHSKSSTNKQLEIKRTNTYDKVSRNSKSMKNNNHEKENEREKQRKIAGEHECGRNKQTCEIRS